jgi:GNAT superfamily N-acetyltransferase
MPATLEPWFGALVGRPGWTFVVAEADSRIAATGAVFVDGSTAWLGVGATLAEYRNRGAQSALLAARIALAADAGCTAIATETGESIAGEVNPSLNNIRRAGFVQVCSRLNYALVR